MKEEILAEKRQGLIWLGNRENSKTFTKQHGQAGCYQTTQKQKETRWCTRREEDSGCEWEGASYSRLGKRGEKGGKGGKGSASKMGGGPVTKKVI